MPTSQLGSINSQLGNFQLGIMPGGGLTQTINESLTFTEVMRGATNLLTDSFTLTDDISAETVLYLEITDSLTLVDGLRQTWIVSFDDTLTLTDDFTGIINKLASWTDTIAFVDDLVAELTIHKTVTEQVIFVESWVRAINRLLSFSDTVSFSEVLTGIAVKHFGDSVTFSDVLTYFVAKVFRDTIEFSDTLSANFTLNKNTADMMALFDSLTYTSFLRLTLGDTLTFTDSMRGGTVKELTDTITLADVTSATVSKPISDTLPFTEQYNINSVSKRAAADVVTFADTIRPTLVLRRDLLDVLAFTEVMRGIRQKFGTFTDSISLTDQVLREVHLKSWTDTLTLTDTFSFIKDSSRTFDETLSIAENLQIQASFVRSLPDELVLSDGFIVKIRGGVTSQPEIIQHAPPPSGGYVPSPVWEGVVRILPQTVISGATRSIVLPAPEFNDFVAGQGKIAVQRSMTGRFRVYAKRTTREKLNYRFILPKYKADEFRSFILAEIDNQLNLIDHDGNYWSVKILSDSIDFTETKRWSPCGNAVDVTLEFVGNRYA